MRLSLALFSFAKLSLKPRPSFAQCMVRETERRLEQLDARVCVSLPGLPDCPLWHAPT